MVMSGRYYRVVHPSFLESLLDEFLNCQPVCCSFCAYMHALLFQYITRSFSDMNTNPAPERTWSLSSKEVKALSQASGSDHVYALTEDEVSENMFSLTSFWCTLALEHVFIAKQSSNTFLSHLPCSNPYNTLPPPPPHTNPNTQHTTTTSNSR